MELIVVLIVALIILGPKRLPEAGRGLGQAIRGFKRSVAGKDDELANALPNAGDARTEHAPVA
jgi:sec-independent protein translocase protein TatA